jgi:hypothetical protein
VVPALQAPLRHHRQQVIFSNANRTAANSLQPQGVSPNRRNFPESLGFNASVPVGCVAIITPITIPATQPFIFQSLRVILGLFFFCTHPNLRATRESSTLLLSDTAYIHFALRRVRPIGLPRASCRALGPPGTGHALPSSPHSNPALRRLRPRGTKPLSVRCRRLLRRGSGTTAFRRRNHHSGEVSRCGTHRVSKARLAAHSHHGVSPGIPQ